jgi:AcrR family transcriptional regulator
LPTDERAKPKRRGRRPGDAAVTRAAILDAARATFSELGYECATIRGIAARAGVDPALVHHHFGPKHSLFVAAHEFPVDPVAVLSKVLASTDPDRLGEAIARFYVTTIFVPEGPVPSLLRAAATNPQAASMLREFIERGVIGRFEVMHPVPDIRLRVALVGSHLVGLFVARHLIGVKDLAELETEELIRLITPTIQRYLSEPLGS